MTDKPTIETPNGKVMHIADWVSLRDYIDLRFEMAQQAVDKAERTMNSRLESMNEFRDTLKDQAGKFVTRDEVQMLMRPVCDDIRSLRTLADKQEGKASQNSVLLTALVAIIGLFLGIIRLFKI